MKGVLIWFLCVFGNMFCYLDIFRQILSNKFKKKHLQLNLIAYPPPPRLCPCKMCFSSCGGSLKIEAANDGCAGDPSGSPWSKFKQSFSPMGMCVHHSSDCVCVCACSLVPSIPIVHLFLILSSCSSLPEASGLHRNGMTDAPRL